MRTESRTFDSEQEAKDWIAEIKVTDPVISDRKEQNSQGKWEAFVEIE